MHKFNTCQEIGKTTKTTFVLFREKRKIRAINLWGLQILMAGSEVYIINQRRYCSRFRLRKFRIFNKFSSLPLSCFINYAHDDWIKLKLTRPYLKITNFHFCFDNTADRRVSCNYIGRFKTDKEQCSEKLNNMCNKVTHSLRSYLEHGQVFAVLIIDDL